MTPIRNRVAYKKRTRTHERNRTPSTKLLTIPGRRSARAEEVDSEQREIFFDSGTCNRIVRVEHAREPGAGPRRWRRPLTLN